MPDRLLICFALPEEARPFRKLTRGRPDVQVLVTGIGRRNAAASVRAALTEQRPRLVITSGFAGGLDPALARGTVVFEANATFPLADRLEGAGARRVRFYCADRMAVTAAEKQRLREMTGADAVEMESTAIQAVCREANLQCATVRVISDAADEDLPLDFNQFARADQSLELGKLALAIVRRPRLLAPLLRLRRTTREAATRLAAVLTAVTAA